MVQFIKSMEYYMQIATMKMAKIVQTLKDQIYLNILNDANNISIFIRLVTDLKEREI